MNGQVIPSSVDLSTGGSCRTRPVPLFHPIFFTAFSAIPCQFLGPRKGGAPRVPGSGRRRIAVEMCGARLLDAGDGRGDHFGHETRGDGDARGRTRPTGAMPHEGSGRGESGYHDLAVQFRTATRGGGTGSGCGPGGTGLGV